MSKRKRSRKSVGTAARAGGATDGGREPQRFSARRKTETILRLLRAESLDSLARELGVTAATLAQWLRATVGEITMSNELLLERCHRLEVNLPLPRRRPSE